MSEKQFDKTNTGTLQKSKEKRDEKDRDYNGSINIEGKEYWLSGWKKDGQYGPFLSLSAKLKTPEPRRREERRESYNRAQEENTNVDF